MHCNPIGFELLLTYDFIHFKIFLASNGGSAGGAGTGTGSGAGTGAGTGGGTVPGSGTGTNPGSGTAPGGGTAATTTAATGATTTSKFLPTMLERDDCYYRFLSQFGK